MSFYSIFLPNFGNTYSARNRQVIGNKAHSLSKLVILTSKAFNSDR